MIASESPGNIKNQVGRSLNAIREAFEKKDLEGIADQTDFLVTLASPYIGEAEEGDLELPDFDEDRATHADYARFYRQVRRIQRRVLRILAARNIYAWTTPPEGDASAAAIKDEDETVEVPAAG